MGASPGADRRLDALDAINVTGLACAALDSRIAVRILLAAPWYVLAEIRTPGFLEYFVIGEHWNRFAVPG